MTPPNTAPAPELPESKLAEMEERQCPTSADLLLRADSVADRLLDARKESMIASQIAYDVTSRAWRDGYKKGWEEARTDLPEAVEQIRRLRAEVAELRNAIGYSLNVLGTGECLVNTCEGCYWELREAMATLRSAIDAAKEPK